MLKSWFLKPYPFPTTTKAKLLISLGFGKVVFLFLLIFQPFNFNNIEENNALFALSYGLITFVIMLISLFAIPLLFPKYFNPVKWVVYKMLFFVLGIEFVISIANWYFSLLTLKEIASDLSLSFFLIATTTIGVIPVLAYLYILEYLRNKKHSSIAEQISNRQYHQSSIYKVAKDTITLRGDNKKELFTMLINDLLYINSEKNYASIFYYQEGQLKEQLLRTPLTKIEQQLQKFDFIVRCHKSYIVNTLQVEKLQGNARSYLLKIKEVTPNQKTILIPVSRSFPKELLFTLVG